MHNINQLPIGSFVSLLTGKLGRHYPDHHHAGHSGRPDHEVLRPLQAQAPPAQSRQGGGQRLPESPAEEGVQ